MRGSMDSTRRVFRLRLLSTLALWIFVLDKKIRHGPQEPSADREPPMHGPPGGVAAAIAGGKTLTGAR